MSKKKEKKVEAPKADDALKADAPKVEAPKADDAPKVEAEELPKGNYVKVKNNSKYFHVQRSTGLRIESGEVKELSLDGWLEAEIKAGLFSKVG